MSNNMLEKYGSSELLTKSKYTFYKYENTDRKYSEFIEKILEQDPDFKKGKSGEIVDWSDKNSKSRVKDYYPFYKISMVDKKYLPMLFPKIIPNTYVDGDFNDFVKKSKRSVFFLKPADKYIGGSNGIEISNDPYVLYEKFVKDKYVIQEEIEPMLINGFKFDIRSYVLIVYNKSYFHVYYNYGIIRYCKEPYVENSTNLDNQISIHGKYEYVIDNKLLDPYLIEIKNIIYLTLLDLKIPNEMGYQYLGYDIMISKSGIPYLIEVNIQPSLKRVNYNIDIINHFNNLVVKSVLTTNKGYRPFISKTYMFNKVLLTLVEPNLKHLDELYSITKNYNIMQYIGNLKIWSYEKTKKFIEYGPSNDYYYKIIIINNKVMGVIGMYRNKTKYYNLTIFLGKKNSRKGIGSAALKLFLLTIEIKQLFADVLNNNIQSINFFKKLGYSFIIMNNIHRFKILDLTY
jgi:RimJ/RimL family protein N-acetyltransferase